MKKTREDGLVEVNRFTITIINEVAFVHNNTNKRKYYC
jgi:hypothetical protein